MNQNKKEYSTIDKHLCLRTRPTDYRFCSSVTRYPGCHHLTHISCGNQQRKKRGKKYTFPLLAELIHPCSSTTSVSPNTTPLFFI